MKIQPVYEPNDVPADWDGERHAGYLQALETLDSREGDALDVATFLRAEHMTGEGE